MSLLTQPSSIAAKQDAAKARIAAITRAVWNDLQIRQRDGMELFWQNPDGLTPQQVADAFGTDAAKLFTFNTALVEFLVAVGTSEGVAPNISAPTNAFTVNPDGTVTVLETPYVPS